MLRMIADGPCFDMAWPGSYQPMFEHVLKHSPMLRLGHQPYSEHWVEIFILHAALAEYSLRPPQPPAMARRTASLGSEECTPSTAAPATPAVGLHGVTSPWGRESAVTIGSRVGDGLISRYESSLLPASVQGMRALDADQQSPGQCCTMAFLYGTRLNRLAHVQLQLRLECCARTLMQSKGTGSNHVHRWWSLGETSAHVEGAQMMGKPSVAFRKARRPAHGTVPCVEACRV